MVLPRSVFNFFFKPTIWITKQHVAYAADFRATRKYKSPILMVLHQACILPMWMLTNVLATIGFALCTFLNKFLENT